MSRKSVPVATQIQLLVSSRRRCCLCFGLDSDDTQKKGQIAHVDRDSSNAELDNLAFLCMPHHDEYDSIPRQTKAILPGELKHYRSKLYEHLSQSRLHPPELILTKQELREWVQRRQRITFGISISLIPIFFILQFIIGTVVTRSQQLPTLTLEPSATTTTPRFELNSRSLDRVKTTDTPVNSSDRPDDKAKDKVDEADTKDDSPANASACDLNLKVLEGGEALDSSNEEERKAQYIKFKIICFDKTLTVGETFSAGSVTLAAPATLPQWKGSPSRSFMAGTELSWRNFDIEYVGERQFAATKTFQRSTFSSFPNGRESLYAVRTVPLGFDPLASHSPGFSMIFVTFLLATALAWGSRKYWERYIIRKHRLTVAG